MNHSSFCLISLMLLISVNFCSFASLLQKRANDLVHYFVHPYLYSYRMYNCFKLEYLNIQGVNKYNFARHRNQIGLRRSVNDAN